MGYNEIDEMLPHPFLGGQPYKLTPYRIINFFFPIFAMANPGLVFRKVQLWHHIMTKVLKKIINPYLCIADGLLISA